MCVLLKAPAGAAISRIGPVAAKLGTCQAVRFRRNEDGAFTIFGLYLFILMVIIGGMAVDLMRFETKRVQLQGTLDAATLAATNLRQELDSELLIRDFMRKRGYDPELVAIDVEPTYVGSDGSTIVARNVATSYPLDVDTFFMHMLDIDTLSTTTGSAAFQGVQNVEISLVVDISGSMQGSKIAALKESAKDFVRAVIDESNTENATSISLVAYNHAVVVPDILLDRLNTSGAVPIPEANQAPYAGALTAYPRTAANSRCVRFSDDQLMTSNLASDWAAIRAVSPSTVLDRMAYYDVGDKSAGAGGTYSRPADDFNRRCDPTRTAILPFETSIAALETAIDGMTADGWTAIDTGMKWGTALLDPAMRPVINSLVTAEILPDLVRDRPGDYDPASTIKIVVLMTDGANTVQYDLKSNFKNGPSRIWFSEKASRDDDPDGAPGNTDWKDLHVVDSNEDGLRDRAKEWFDGYYVEMPGNSASERFMRQHRLGTSGSDESDAVLYGVTEVPDDLRQLSYTELYDRFSENAVSEFFRDNDVGDDAARRAHRDAEEIVENNFSANERLSGSPRDSFTEFGICDAAKFVRPGETQPDIRVFTIAFEVPVGGDAENTMRDCATDDDYFYNASDEEELAEAFGAIAGAITMLTLTQ